VVKGTHGRSRKGHLGPIGPIGPAARTAAALVLAAAACVRCAPVAPQALASRHGVPFNGFSTHAVVLDGKAFDLDTFTVSAWVKLHSLREPQVFVNRGTRAQLFTLYLFKGKVRMLVEYAPDKYAYANADAPKTEEWTHYLGTYDGTVITVYANGVPAGTAKAPGRLPPSEAPLYLGAEAPWASTLDGWLDDVRTWRRALAADEARRVAFGGEVAPADLVGRWRKDTLRQGEWRNMADESLSAEYLDDSKRPVRKDDGYRGIWYYNQPSNDEYVYKYSGGLGTYCAKHRPFAIYSKEANKTFFCYGGTPKGKNELLHMVSYYDHATGMVPRPTILLNKHTDDAHDNPVISLDANGYVWVFSSSHGTSRPSSLSRSTKPYSVEEFEHVLTTNFSYTQPWWLPGRGFLFIHTRYQGGRCNYQMTSPDGREWSEGKLLAKIDEGHYQVSEPWNGKVGTAFNYHPQGTGLNWRTNLYYMETDDFGETWHNAQGKALTLPLTEVENPALVHDYKADGLNVYMKDLAFDSKGNPLILCLTSKGYESGPENDPRVWTTARWTGTEWDLQGSIRSDNNYDTGSLYVETDTFWRLIGPTQPGPQPYNPGGEVALWTSEDLGHTWKMVRQLTHDSAFNHTYVRRPVNAHPDFYAFWADGHARKPSESRLYFCDKTGEHVWRLPPVMEEEFASPELVR